MANGRIASLQMEITGIEKRVKIIEDKIEVLMEEVERLKKKVDEALEVVPHVKELAQIVENSKKIQDNTNVLIFSEIAAAHHATSTLLGTLIQRNTSEIASLSVCYQQIYDFITGFLNSVNDRNQTSCNNTYSNYNIPPRSLSPPIDLYVFPAFDHFKKALL